MRKVLEYKLNFIFLFCFICFMWQSTHSQLLNLDHDYKKDEYLPPYDPNAVYISSDVEKWMNEQFVKGNDKKTVKMKTDVLGRAISSSDGIGQEKIVEIKQRRLVAIYDMHIPQIEMKPMQGRYEYNSETKSYNYYLNGKEMNAKEYDDFMKNYNEEFNRQNKGIGRRNLPIPGLISSSSGKWIALMTAEEISALTKNYKELVIEDYIEPVDEASVASILSNIQLFTHAFPNGYEGYAVGAGVVELSCRDTNIPLYRQFRYTNHCTGTTSTHHSGVVNIVQHASPLAHVFGFRESTNEHPNPDSYFPPLQVVTYSYGAATGLSYSGSDMYMDNYIYDRRIIAFKSAGNTGNYITSPGKALNIITVGAVCPAAPCRYPNTTPNNYTSYSSWKNSEIGNEKPEQGMYTDIDMGIYGFLDGTSAAAPLLAGFTATVLDQHPFFKRHPALMKAVLLTGETIPILNARPHDQDNYKSAQKITNYSSVAWGTRSWYCEGGNSACFNANNNTEIHITENNIQANRHYRIAIAWLSEGNYVFQNKRIQQDIDLYVYQNGQYLGGSASVNNPFEIVDFVTNSNAPLNITIRRYRNSGGNVLLGYHLRDNF
jgi:hypothetical protein